ncbi:MAG: acyl-CoA desaturase [Chitinophagaceae bacterium]|nr:acyl-CoA desaturase [Chitinophagaceae bacterium]
MAKVTFNCRSAAFYNDLKKGIDQYFAEKGLKKTGNWKLHIKTISLGAAAIFLYVILLKFNFSLLAGLVLSGTLGFVLASIGFNVMHDACHGSYSDRKWLNNTLGLSLNALGGNAFIWKFKHNIIHHTYTNIDGVDDDIAKSPVMRQCNTQKWVPAHRFQHIYVVLVYAISSFAWVFLMDFTKYFSRKVFTTPLQKMSSNEHLVFWISKLMYAVFYIAIPVHFVGWAAWGVGFAAMHVVMGLTLALVFQLAHVVEQTEFELAGIEPKQIENEWAIHQVKTTANFAPKNLIVSWFVGGLNYQVEHHLFPRVSHIHYPGISRIVEETCERHNLPYNVYSTMTGAVVSHFRMMRTLGRKPVAALAS